MNDEQRSKTSAGDRADVQWRLYGAAHQVRLTAPFFLPLNESKPANLSTFHAVIGFIPAQRIFE